MSEVKISWRGASGKKYEYRVYPLDTAFKAKPGNYVFAKLAAGKYTPIYAGETQDLSERFDSHHKLPCIRKHGATHITAHITNGGAAVRRAEEQDIIEFYDPVCNG